MSNRIGKLEVSFELLIEKPDLFDTHLSDCRVISREEPAYGHPHSVIFTVECPEFDELPTNGYVPVYEFTFERSPDHTVRRLSVTKRPIIGRYWKTEAKV